MKAIKELGSAQIIKFFLFTFVNVLYSYCTFPPVRKFFLKAFGAEIKTDSIIMNVKLINWHKRGIGGLKVGKECFIGDETLIDLYDEVIFDDQVTIAQRVTILTHLNVGYQNHPLQKYFPRISKPVIFQNGSVVGAGAIILPGVEVGKKSFIAAGSVVTKNVPARTLVGGVPAKIIRKIT